VAEYLDLAGAPLGNGGPAGVVGDGRGAGLCYIVQTLPVRVNLQKEGERERGKRGENEGESEWRLEGENMVHMQ
jgi:hypothetical protein